MRWWPVLTLFLASCATTQTNDGEEDTEIYLSIDVVTKHCKVPELKAYFRFDSAQVDRANHRSLNALAKCLTEGPLKGARIELVGHADPIGTEEYNNNLGLERAREVARYLTGRGVSDGRISVRSAGSVQAPKYELARRVDIRLIDCTIDPTKKCADSGP